MRGEPILQMKNVSCSYEEGIKALDNVTVDLFANERIAVMGANGAGKSTFFLCMNGVLRPDSGQILLHGREMDKKNLRELREHVGIVFQDADSQLIAPTVFAEVSFGPMNLKLPRQEVLQRTEASLDYMALARLSDRAPHYLSGGEKKRVAIADIIAMEPEVFVFDEPASSLDPVNRQMLETVLGRLEQAGKTILVSTHDVDFAYRFASRILVFSEGRIVGDSSPIEIFSNEELLFKAHLKRPALLEFWQMLLDKKIVKHGGVYPKTLEELGDLL